MKRLLFFLIVPILLSTCISSKGLAIKTPNQETFETSVEDQLDHSAWDALLKEHVDFDGMVDYKGFKVDIDKVNNYVNFLGKNIPDKNWSYEELLAYYINVYNANTIKLVLDNYPVKSIKDIDATISPFLKKFIKIGEKDFSLADIEKGILQKMKEPRIHFAINCASFSCPKLMRDAYTAENVNELMEQAAEEFINSEKNELSPNSVKLSEIFKWYKDDFLLKSPSIIEYINQYSEIEISADASVDYIQYNWDLNDIE